MRALAVLAFVPLFAACYAVPASFELLPEDEESGAPEAPPGPQLIVDEMSPVGGAPAMLPPETTGGTKAPKPADNRPQDGDPAEPSDPAPPVCLMCPDGGLHG